jgi:AAHS family 4-hydroxybenzoate transporter-like MFS transporter
MSSGAMTIDAVINGRRTSALQAVTLILCFLVVAADGFDVAAVSFVAPLLKTEWSLGPQLALVFGAGLLGLTIGSFLFGPLADRIGRKRVIVLSVVLFGLASLATAASPSVGWLIALRLVTGVGLGGGMPTSITLSSEFSPERHRPMLVTLMFCGFTLGLAFGGSVAGLVMPSFGWRSVFVVGGVAPLVLAPVLWRYLPESLRFMAGKRRYEREAGAVLAKLAGHAEGDVAALYADEPAPSAPPRAPAAILFNAYYRTGTLLLWLAFFCTLWVYYQISSWLPLVLSEAHFSPEGAAFVASLLPVAGTIGALINAYLMARADPFLVLTCSYVVAALSIACIGATVGDPTVLAIAVFGSGLGLSGAQTGANVLVAGFYATEARATGVSWALGTGRVGAILGATTGGVLLAALRGPQMSFFAFAIPALVAAAAMLTAGRLYRPIARGA